MFRYKDMIIEVDYDDKHLITFIKNKDGKYEKKIMSKKYKRFHYKDDSPFVLAKTSEFDYVLLHLNKNKNEFNKITKKFDKKYADINKRFVRRETNVFLTNDEVFYYDKDKNKPKLLLYKFRDVEYFVPDNDYILVRNGAIDNDKGDFVMINLKDGNMKSFNDISHIYEAKNFGDNTDYYDKIVLTYVDKNGSENVALFDTKNGDINTVLNDIGNKSVLVTDNTIMLIDNDKTRHNNEVYVINKKKNNLIKIDDPPTSNESYVMFGAINHDIVFRRYNNGKYDIYRVDYDNDKIIKIGNSDVVNGVQLEELYRNKRDVFIGSKGDKTVLFRINKKTNKVEEITSNLSTLYKQSIIDFANNESNYLITNDGKIYYYDENNNKLVEIKDKSISDKLKEDDYKIDIINGNKDNGMLVLHKTIKGNYPTPTYIQSEIYAINKTNVKHLKSVKFEDEHSVGVYFIKYPESNDSLLITDIGILIDYKTNDPKFVVINEENPIPYGEAMVVGENNKMLVMQPYYHGDETVIFPNYTTDNSNLEHSIKIADLDHIRDNVFVHLYGRIIQINPDTYKKELMLKFNSGTTNTTMVREGYSNYLIGDSGIIHIPSKRVIQYNLRYKFWDNLHKFSIVSIANKEIQLTNNPLEDVISLVTEDMLNKIC